MSESPDQFEEEDQASEAHLAQEVTALERLHQMTGHVVTAPHMQAALDEILDTSVALLQADFGNVQLLDQEQQTLEIVAQVGFQEPFLDAFTVVGADDDSACGRALRSGRRAVIEDVEVDAGYEPYWAAAEAAGYRAVQSTPLVSRKGEIFGVLSTHYRQPCALSERDERLLDLLARQAADLLERLHAEKALEERVQARTAQVRRLASELILSEQKVRHRISQVLHDNLQQLLYAQEMQLQFLREDTAGDSLAPEQADALDRLDEMIQESLRLTRQLTVELSPPVLKGEGLVEALAWLARHMNDLYGLQVAVHSSDHTRIPDKDRRILLFQIVRELLFNVVKHAGVLEAHVTLRSENGGITIEVVDAGQGFDVAQVPPPQDGGFGLHSVRERLQLFGGRFEIRSQPGAGTRATLFLPYQSAPDSAGER